jgi:4-amino-4-deoxy-L-arabinose transferase-like glycosyltransferase
MPKNWLETIKFNPQKFDLFCIFSLLIASLFIYLICLGNLPLRDWDEGTRALVAREIYRTGNWLYPTINNQPYFAKPPLMMWLVAFCYHVGGVNEFTTRFLPSLLTALGPPLLYLIGKEIFDNKLSPLFSSLVYLTLLPVVRHGRLMMLDGMIITFFLFSLWCLLKSKSNKFWGLGIGLGLGLVAFNKSILVFVFVLIMFIFGLWEYLYTKHQTKVIVIGTNYYLYLGLIIGFFPLLWWYFLQYQYYGYEFIRVHFFNQGFDRVSKNVEGNSGAIWYYVLELVKYAIPWFIFLPQGLLYAWKNRKESWSILTLTGFFIYLAIISIMETKLPWYIMPIYPFFALIIGSYLASQWQKVKIFSKFYLEFFGFLSLVSALSIIYFGLVEKQLILVVMAITLSVFMGLVAWKIKQGDRLFIPILALGIYLTLSFFIMSKSWIWELNEAFAVKPVANLIRENTLPQTRVYMSFGYNRPSLDFYSDRPVIAANISNLLQNLSNEEVYLLLDESNLASLNLPYQVLGTTDNFTLIKCQILR